MFNQSDVVPKPTSIRFSPKAWAALLAHHRHGKCVEHLSVAFARVVETERALVLLIDEGDVILFDRSHCSKMQALGVALSKDSLKSLMWAFAQSGRRGFVTIHDHWFSKAGTQFSGQDDRDNLQQDRYLREVFEPMLRKNPNWGAARDVVHASIVFDQTTIDARVVDTRFKAQPFVPVRVLTCANDRWLRTQANSSDKKAQEREIHARHKDFLTDQSLADLARLRIGIVGCGGLGPILAENLARLGVGELVLVDPDQLDESNLNRWLGGRASEIGRNKAELLAEHIVQELPWIKCQAVVENLLDGAATDALVDCDFVFGGLDSDAARLFLNRLSIQYLIPYFDVSVKVQVKPSFDFLARFVPILPGHTACMECAPEPLLNANRIEKELAPFLSKLRKAEGYVADVDVKSPSVLALNMRSASDAILEFLGYLSGWPKLQGTDLRFAGTQLALTRWRNGLRIAVDPQQFTPKASCFCASELGVGSDEPLPKRRTLEALKVTMDSLQSAIDAQEGDTIPG